VEEIDRAAQRASTLTRQLLSFSRKQQSQPDLRVDLNKVVLGMDSMIRAMLGKRYALTIETEAELGVTRADPAQLEQVVLNLIMNARDAMPKGGNITIRTANAEIDEAFARTHPGSRPGAYVSLSVADTGTGMDEQVKAHIFEPFFTTKAERQGTGLGLAIVYGVVKQTGSYIAVDSEIDRGTTFTVYLPRLVAPVPELKLKPASTASSVS
jgi:signal transduction histidine kinase